MSPTKLSNFVSRILIIFGFSFFFNSNLVGEESIDIWKKENKNIKKTIQKENTVENSKIDYSKKDKSLGQIKIIDTDEEEKELASLPGLYDPEQNDLRMSMWSNTDGLSIKNTFNRISKIKMYKTILDFFIKIYFCLIYY